MIDSVRSLLGTEPHEIPGVELAANGSASDPESGGNPADDVRLGALGRALGSLAGQARPAIETFVRQIQDSGRLVPGPVDSASGGNLPGALDEIFDLNEGGLSNLLTKVSDMSAAEVEDFLQSLAKLLRHGIVGYEVREVNGIPRKMFISAAIGSDFHRAPLVRSGGVDILA